MQTNRKLLCFHTARGSVFFSNAIFDGQRRMKLSQTLYCVLQSYPVIDGPVDIGSVFDCLS